ncbi:NAD(P)-binding protein [Fomitopsis serialis]|uniref:NAD(P)-binding protein n=1 Tax=Fomitopsis serialis TaxID=139415 RepID=UPI002007A8FF|nr:NAD(P)-binding protein [Neoantrodia serialis]KAH9933902.1 NAD(P)-binding protein [Neoantrodia serialis]
MSSDTSRPFDPDNASDVPPLADKVVVVTGGNGGIGYATIQHLARHGAKVYMAARSETKAQEAIERLHAEGLAPGNGQVLWLQLDLSDPVLAQKSARVLLAKEDRLDVLINNAAMPRGPYARTKHDIQDAMMVNHIGPFVFTMTLLPLLAKTAVNPASDVRIVNITSGGIAFLKRGIRFRNRDDFNDEHKWDIIPGPSLARYLNAGAGRSKLANVLFTTELQRRLDEAGVPILALSVDPGLVRTGGVENDAASQPPGISHVMSLLIRALWTPPTRGAFTSVFAAAAPAVRQETERYKAAYLLPPGRIGAPPHPDARNPVLARELWDTTERLLREMGIDWE